MSIVEKALHRLDVERRENESATAQPATFLQQPPKQPASKLVLVGLLGGALGVLFMVLTPWLDKTSPVPATATATRAAAIPTPAPNPAPAPTPQASLASAQIDRSTAAQAAVRLAVTQWTGAWTRRDVDAYLAFYAADFTVPNGLTRAAWQAQRKSRISKPASLQVEVRQVEVDLADETNATVHLVQDFRSDNYREVGTRKELRLKNTNERWLIVSEKSL